jgi:hypothetical protein
VLLVVLVLTAAPVKNDAAGLDTGERAELVELRRKTRVQAVEIDILERIHA